MRLALKNIYKCSSFAGRSSDLKYVTGYVLGRSFSGVQGYVRNHRFYGTIFVRNSVLFVEPIVSNNQIRFPYYVTSSRRMVKKKGSLNAYVYKIYSRNLRRKKAETTRNVKSHLKQMLSEQHTVNNFLLSLIHFHMEHLTNST